MTRDQMLEQVETQADDLVGVLETDSEMGRKFRLYVQGLIDTQFEGFATEDLGGLGKVLEDFRRALPHL